MDIQNRRSEEISDIIERMPTRFGRWVALAVVVFALLLLLFGWLIKYPDTVNGKITINSSRAPIKLIANSSGKLKLLCDGAQAMVKTDEYIAILQNAANTEDVRTVIHLLSLFDVNSDSLTNFKKKIPEKVSLGELNLKYFSFLTALKTICNYNEENTFEEEQKKLTENIAWQKVLLAQTETVIQTTKERTDISEKWVKRNEILNKKDAVSEVSLDQARNEYLSTKNNYQSLQKESTSIRLQISEAENRLGQLNIERHEKENEMNLKLQSTFHDLLDNLKIWEQNYVFKAPFDGYVEFMKFWTNGEFVTSGEEVFGIVPLQSDIIGQVLLPASGAGKVKLNDKVIIKLDNYPYIEFGSVNGFVKSISLITKQQRTENSSIETYLVTVGLPEGLITNYGESLDFKYEIKGTADIVIRKRRLIERLFDNLKYRTK